MSKLHPWEANNEISGGMELRIRIPNYSIEFAKFLKPQKVTLITQNSEKKRTIEEVLVDFVYSTYQSDGTDSAVHEGAGFLKSNLQYLGFTRYNSEKRKIYARRYEDDFLKMEAKNLSELKQAIKKYYGEGFSEFRQAINSLPEDMKDIAKKLLL